MKLDKNPLAMKSGDVVSKPKREIVIDAKTVLSVKKRYVLQYRATANKEWRDYSRMLFRNKEDAEASKREREKLFTTFNFCIIKRTIIDEIIDGNKI